MLRCLLSCVGVVLLALPTIAEEPQAVKAEVEKLSGIWSNEALAKSEAADATRLHVTLSSPKFDEDGGARFEMSIKIWNKDEDGGGGRTVMLLKDEKNWLLSVGSPESKFKGLPAAIPYRFEEDKLILTIKDGDWKGEHILKKKWEE